MSNGPIRPRDSDVWEDHEKHRLDLLLKDAVTKIAGEQVPPTITTQDVSRPRETEKV